MKVTGENWGKSIRELQWSGRTDSIEMTIRGNSLAVDATADNTDYSAAFEIKYCPFCGKRVAH